MPQIAIFDKTADITKRNVDIIVAPVNRSLETGGAHKFLDYVIYNHRYELRITRELIPDKSKVKFGDVYVIPEEDGKQSSLMYYVLEPASETRYQEQLTDFYENSFKKALEFGAKSVRFPSLSHGIFKYPMEEVVRLGLKIAAQFDRFESIEFFCYNDAYYELFKESLASFKK